MPAVLVAQSIFCSASYSFTLSRRSFSTFRKGLNSSRPFQGIEQALQLSVFR